MCAVVLLFVMVRLYVPAPSHWAVYRNLGEMESSAEGVYRYFFENNAAYVGLVSPSGLVAGGKLKPEIAKSMAHKTLPEED